jgi:hypothetical protein
MLWRQTAPARFLTAGLLVAFSGATYWFTIHRQAQENFSDIDDKGNPIKTHNPV